METLRMVIIFSIMPGVVIFTPIITYMHLNPSFHMLVNRGDVVQVKKLLVEGQDVNDVVVGSGAALHIAIEKDNPAMVRLLLDHGADVNAMSFFYGTPLRLAVNKENASIAKLLFTNGAYLNRKNGDGHTLESVIDVASWVIPVGFLAGVGVKTARVAGVTALSARGGNIIRITPKEQALKALGASNPSQAAIMCSTSHRMGHPACSLF